MTKHDITDLHESVTALRAQTFELIDRMRTAAWTGERPLAIAAAQIQSAANGLGTVESMLSFDERAA